MSDEEVKIIDIHTKKAVDAEEIWRVVERDHKNKRKDIPYILSQIEATLYNLADSGYDIDAGIMAFPENALAGDSIAVMNFSPDPDLIYQRSMLKKSLIRIENIIRAKEEQGDYD